MTNRYVTLRMMKYLLKDDEVPSTIVLPMQFGIKFFTIKKPSITTSTYGTEINVCSCKNSNFINQHHGHILTGDLRVIKNDKLRKMVSKGPNYRESKTTN